jgi:hypothetical protein
LVALVEVLRDVLDDPELLEEDEELAELADGLPPTVVLVRWLDEQERLLASASCPVGQSTTP